MKIMLVNHRKMSVEKFTDECFSFLTIAWQNTFQYEYRLKHFLNSITPFDGKPIRDQEVLKCRVKHFPAVVTFKQFLYGLCHFLQPIQNLKMVIAIILSCTQRSH